MRKLKIYVSCSLTHAPEEYKENIKILIKELQKIDFVEILEFCSPLPGQQQSVFDALDVYHNDIHECVEHADVLISEISLPSTGLGFELGTAMEKHSTHVIMLAHNDAVVSKLILGAALAHGASVYRYNQSIMEHMPDLVTQLKHLYHGKVKVLH